MLSDKILFIIAIIIIIVSIKIYNFYNKKEGFDVLLEFNSIRGKVDLMHLFQFIDFYTSSMMDPNPKYQHIRQDDYMEESNIKRYIDSIQNNIPKFIGPDYKIYMKDVKDMILSDTKRGGMLRYNILHIISTDTYKKYIYNYKYSIKYRGIIFNPNMIYL